jgi:Arc/MetJ-type ribon-helix-helix transcriptional regulator
MSATKRCHLRLIPEDHSTLTRMQHLTTYRTKSDVVRGAIRQFQQLWELKSSGYLIKLRNDELKRQFEIHLASPVVAGSNGEGVSTPKSSAKSETLEVRLSPEEDRILEALVKAGAATTRSEAIRRALGVYAQIVSHCDRGWELVALSPEKGILPVAVLGLESQQDRATPKAFKDASELLLDEARSDRGRTLLREGSNGHHGTNGAWVIPDSLSIALQELADSMQCDPQVLLVEMLWNQLSLTQKPPLVGA